MKKYALGNWKGSGKDGSGTITTQSEQMKQVKICFSSRFEDGKGTNPEELLAAAHVGCFTMKLSFLISEAGFIPENIDSRCDITLDLEKAIISLSHITLKATIPGITLEKFNEVVEDAKENCPVSKLFNSEITIEAILVEAN